MISFRAFTDELMKLAASKSQFALAQSRAGRRPMSVDTLLKKEKEGTLYRKEAGASTASKDPPHKPGDVPTAKGLGDPRAQEGVPGVATAYMRPLV